MMHRRWPRGSVGVLVVITLGCGRPDPAPSRATPPSGNATAVLFSESRAYERFMGRWSRQLAGPFVEFAGVRDGDIVLDVGSGTGSLSAVVLARGARTRVVGIDPTPAYVAAAQARLGGAARSVRRG